MDATLLFPSKYLKAADLKGRAVTVTIEKVQIDQLQMVGGRKEKKPVVYLKGTEKMWVLNKTNCKLLIELLGNETDSWAGKRVVLHPTRDRFQGKLVPCLRVKGSPDAVKSQAPEDEPMDGLPDDDAVGEPAEDEPVREPGQDG